MKRVEQNTDHKSRFGSKRGSAILASVMVALVIGAWMAATMQSSFTEYKMSKRYLDMQSALNLAESGLEEGIRAFNDGNWTGWTSYSNGYYQEIDASTLSAGLDGAIKIYVKDSANYPVIAAEGHVVDISGNKIKKQIRVELSKSSLYANGILARNEVIFNGNTVLVDSYDSTLGSYTDASYANRFSNGAVASVAVSSSILVNNADIRGYVAIGGSVWNDGAVGPNGSVHAYDYSESDKTDDSRITTDFTADLPAVEKPAYNTYTEMGTINSTTTLGSASNTSVATFQAERLQLNSSEKLVIEGPVRLYVRRNVQISGNAMIEIKSGGSLELYAEETISIAGNGMANSSMLPKNVIIYGAGPANQSVDLAGNAELYAVVYAPDGNIHMNGGGSDGVFCGAVVGNQVELRGGVNFHYDEDLRNLGGGAGLSIDFWRELRTAAELLPFDSPDQLPSYF